MLAMFLCVLAFQFAATAALAWDDEGHEIVGLIAEHYLTASVRQKTDAILAQDRSGLAPADTGDTVADESTWADKYRDVDHRRPHYAETRDWHFVDLEISGPDLRAACFGRRALPPGTPASVGPAHDCAVDKIEEFDAELANPRTTQPERLIALQFLLHLVGDLAQPLHASDDHDRGGNSKRLTSAGRGPGNLHGFWDTELVEALGTDPRKVGNRLIAKITPAEKAAWGTGAPEQWAWDSYSVSKQVAYGALPPPKPNGEYILTASYEAKAKLVVAEQLSKAGVRLAALLNRALSQGEETSMKLNHLASCAAVAVAIAGCSRSPSPGTIGPDQAASHVGENETIEGTVTEVHTARSGRATFINMGGEYPDNAFTGVIFASGMGAVGDVTGLAGKTVDVSGTVRLYRGRPEIVIESRGQIRER